jgi:hypothetical protein
MDDADWLPAARLQQDTFMRAANVVPDLLGSLLPQPRPVVMIGV